jgi:SOS-response transcriptional repressor LexA
VTVNAAITFHFPATPVLVLMAEVDWRERLRAAVTRSGKKQSSIARDAGVAPETLSRVLTSALAHPSFDIVVRIARALNENVGWLLDERGFSLSAEEQKQLRKVVRFLEDTLLGSAGASRRDRPEPNAFADPAAEIPRAYAVRGARVAYEAAGDAMIGAGIADRDLLFVRPTRSTREANGRVVVCRVNGAEYVRVLDVRAGRIRLLSRNERVPAIDVGESGRFELIGIVVGRTGAVGG